MFLKSFLSQKKFLDKSTIFGSKLLISSLENNVVGTRFDNTTEDITMNYNYLPYSYSRRVFFNKRSPRTHMNVYKPMIFSPNHSSNDFYFDNQSSSSLFPVTVNCGNLRRNHVGIYVKIRGRITVQSINKFAQLKDDCGCTQIQIPDSRTDLLNRINCIPDNSFVTVTGKVRLRPENKINTKLRTGEVEVMVDNIEDVFSSRKRKRDYFRTKFNSGGRTIQSRNYSTAKRLTNEELSHCDNEECIQKFLERTYTTNDLTPSMIGTKIKLCGWLDEDIEQNRYLRFSDGFGSIQLVISDEKTDQVLKIIKSLNSKKLIQVIGILCSKKCPISNLKNNLEIVIEELSPLNSQISSNSSVNSDSECKTQNVSNLVQVNKYTTRTHTCGELRLSDQGKEVRLCGWVEFIRMNKFILLRDAYGTTQIIVNEVNEKDSFFSKVQLESVVFVSGVVCARPESQINKKMPTGEIEIDAKSINVTNRSLAKMPFLIRDYLKANDQKLNRYRFLALRFPELQNNLRLRSEMLFKMREFLITRRGFVEVETPTLFKKTPGGAQEFIVPTHMKNRFYSLVQSPQQLKQLLMVGSLDRYFQIARCYRDERTNPEKQPEFTQLDIELSYTTAENVMKLTEDILAASWPSDKKSINVPFPVMSYSEAIEKYGSDKPCLLDKFLIQNLDNYIETVSKKATYMFVISEAQTSYKQLKLKIDKLNQSVSVKVSVVKAPTQEKFHQDMEKILPGFQSKFFETCVPIKNGDVIVLAVGSEKNKTLNALGLCRQTVIEHFHLIEDLNEKGIYDFLWIVDFPLFEKNELDEIKSTHHPFTHPHPEDLGLIPCEAMNARSLAYDLVLNGSEIGGGSIRIHNADLQRTILKFLDLHEEDFSHLLEALEMGCPPHGGIALGIDRLFAIICNRQSIKDVIAFPKGTDGQDLMTGCPNDIPVTDKIRYHIYTPDYENADSSPLCRRSEEEC